MFGTEWSCGDWTMASLAAAFTVALIIEIVKRANKPPEIAKHVGGNPLSRLFQK